jgi:hypothetical protein
MSFLG